MTDIEISVCCYSKKEDASIELGASLDSKESFDTLDAKWIDEGLSDSFWENHQEFEPGIEKAKQIIKNYPNLTFRQALYSVFGDFHIFCEMASKEVDLLLKMDINEAMYDMLEI